MSPHWLVWNGKVRGDSCPIEIPERERGWRLPQWWNITLTEQETWKWRMMVQIRPSVSLGFPSAMSSFLMFTSLTYGDGGTKQTHSDVRMFSLKTCFARAFQLVVVVFVTKRVESRTWRSLRKSSAICTFCSLWKRMRPFSLGCRVVIKRLDRHSQIATPQTHTSCGAFGELPCWIGVIGRTK